MDESQKDKMDQATTPEARKILRMQEKKAEKQNKLKKAKSKQSMRKKVADDDVVDPYLSLGFGLIAYRSTLWSLACTFAFMSMIAFPLIKTYEGGGAIDMNVVNTKFGVYSLANLGYSTVQCATMPFNQKTLTLTCPYGEITNIVDNENGFGVTPYNSKARDACLRDEEKYSNGACSDLLDQNAVKKYFADSCQG